MASLEERLAAAESAVDNLRAMLMSIQRAIALATSTAATAETVAAEARDMASTNAVKVTRLSKAVAAFTNELMAVESALGMPPTRDQGAE